MSRWRLAALALLLATVVCTPAAAREVSGLDIRMDLPEDGAVPGQLYEGRLWILTDRDLVMSEFSIEGRGWSGLTWTQVGSAWLGPDQPLEVEFSGTPRDAASPLVIIARSGDEILRRSLAVGGAEYERTRSPLPTRTADLPVPEPRIDARMGSRSPAPVLPDGWTPTPDKEAQGYNIRVHGRLAYVRADTTLIGADGFTIRVYDDDPILDDLLGTGMTGVDGTFDFNVNWDDPLGEDHPDLKLHFRAENSEVRVKEWWRLTPYIIEAGTWGNFTGTDLDVGVVVPVDEADQAIPHLMTNYTRFWRYLDSHGHDTRFLRVNFPTDPDDGAFYRRSSETIFLPRGSQWASGTQAHEFGHHVMNCWAVGPVPDYCNEVCDPGGDCGHCLWCEEDEGIAWTEGWANYISHTIPNTFDAVYGLAAINGEDMEDLEVCQEDLAWAEPSETEGFTAALLVDIGDSDWDDHAHTAGFDDRLALGDRAVLDVLKDDRPTRTNAFLDDVMEAYPNRVEDLWWTGMNNGYDIDEEVPDVVTPIIAGHGLTPGVPTAKNNLIFFWQRPDDDASGVRRYHAVLSQDAPADPVGSRVIEGDTQTEFPAVAPATYYFNIIAEDWAGNRSVTYTTIGPFIITPPEPRNIVFDLPTGWDFWVAPRNTPDATLTYCPVPASLDETLPTYWNLSGRHEGDLSAGAHLHTTLEIDGVEVDDFNWGDVPGWSPVVVLNDGPLTVDGGLHSVVGRLDPDNLISETDETDNDTGMQFAWRPRTINAVDQYAYLDGVPDPTAGWGQVIDMFAWYNSFGVSFVSSDWWNAFVVWSEDPETDYDARLHEVDTDPRGGFRLFTDSSTQPAGWIDAVVVNRNTAGSQPWDVGVVNPGLDSGILRYRQVTSDVIAFPDTVVEVMSSNDYLLLREFEVGYWETGGISLDLWTDPPQANVSLGWCDADFTTGALLDADAMTLTGSDGHAQLAVVAPETGRTCLMISRRPMDGDDDLQVTYRVQPRLPDLESAHLAGWHAPIVPRTYGTHTPELVERPTVLEGDVETTYFSFAVENTSTGMAWGAMRFQVHIDGYLGGINYLHPFDIEGGEFTTVLDQGPRNVAGGRHTVVIYPDAPGYIEELDEQNNKYGEQYVWIPRMGDWEAVETRSAPPELVGGWEDLQSGDPAWFNCDGMRPMYMSTFWRAYAAMPGAESDVDVRLHEFAAGTQTGFGVNLARSGWGIGESDYCLINHYLADWLPFDAGMLRIHGDEDYTREAPMESMLGSAPVDHGPVDLAAGRIMHLYELQLAPGFWRIWLESTAGTVDWGLTLHRNDLPFMSKTDAYPGGAAWLEGPGADEEVTITIDEAGYYAVTVWKVGNADLDQAGSYNLHVAAWDPSGTAVDELPQVTCLAGIYPNPFNPQTTVQFDLAQPAQVDMTVYDLAGRRVATLVRETYPAGRHHQVWDGRDQAGQRVASGVYLVRMKAGGITDLKKVMLVK